MTSDSVIELKEEDLAQVAGGRKVADYEKADSAGNLMCVAYDGCIYGYAGGVFYMLCYGGLNITG